MFLYGVSKSSGSQLWQKGVIKKEKKSKGEGEGLKQDIQ